MKEKLFVILLSLALCPAFAQKPSWTDNFRKRKIDTDYWSIIPRGLSQWDMFMSDASELYKFKWGTLQLGVFNSDGLITGGIYTKGKVHFGYGRLEIKAKIESAQGVWPAIWMKPVDDIKTPYGGEIDIMEHLNHDDFIYQTIHTGYTYETKNKDQVNSIKVSIKVKEFNIYAVEHRRDYIAFYVNGVETLRYSRNDGDSEYKWPFDRDYFLMIDTQAGGE